jgi:hypothetical protein
VIFSPRGLAIWRPRLGDARSRGVAKPIHPAGGDVFDVELGHNLHKRPLGTPGRATSHPEISAIPEPGNAMSIAATPVSQALGAVAVAVGDPIGAALTSGSTPICEPPQRALGLLAASEQRRRPIGTKPRKRRILRVHARPRNYCRTDSLGDRQRKETPSSFACPSVVAALCRTLSRRSG